MTPKAKLPIETLVHIAEKREITLWKLLSVLKIITQNKQLANNEFIRLTGLPKEHAGRILKDLSFLLEPPSPFIRVTEEGKTEIQGVLVEYDLEKTEILQKKLDTQIEEIARDRPAPLREYDQFLASSQTMKDRAFYLLQKGELLKKNILFLGDDDHTSLVASALGRDIHITVLDIDQRILNSIQSLAQKHNYAITTILHDLRNPLPSGIINTFDTVFTDPPYTASGISLFLNRGIHALKKLPTSHLYFCYGNSDRARERELKIQSIVTDLGLLIEEKNYHFNSYIGAESIGSVSSLYSCSITPQTKRKESTEKNIYTNS